MGLRFGYFKDANGQYVVWRLNGEEQDIIYIVAQEHEAMDLVKQLEAEDF